VNQWQSDLNLTSEEQYRCKDWALLP